MSDRWDGGEGSQVVLPVNGDPFIGMLETPVTSAPVVAGFLSNLPAYRTGVAPLLRGVEIGLAHGLLVWLPSYHRFTPSPSIQRQRMKVVSVMKARAGTQIRCSTARKPPSVVIPAQPQVRRSRKRDPDRPAGDMAGDRDSLGAARIQGWSGETL